jgi:hypothetical protein
MESKFNALLEVVKKRVGKIIDENELSNINQEMINKGFDISESKVVISYPSSYGKVIVDCVYQGHFICGSVCVVSLFETIKKENNNELLPIRLLSVSYFDKQKEKMIEITS